MAKLWKSGTMEFLKKLFEGKTMELLKFRAKLLNYGTVEIRDSLQKLEGQNYGTIKLWNTEIS